MPRMVAWWSGSPPPARLPERVPPPLLRYARSMSSPLMVRFAAGAVGAWRIDRIESVQGERLPAAERLTVLEGAQAVVPAGTVWMLRGVTSNERYVTRAEHDALVAQQPSLARAQATRAAFIPVRKSAAWWDLAQDERRTIFEERSRHMRIGLDYLPAVARRLHHSRELGEPFDFLTWFEYAPQDAQRLVEDRDGRVIALEETRPRDVTTSCSARRR